YGKNFDFPKQHAVSHVIRDLRETGTTNNYTTRLGEGFHQEVKEAYGQTNGKDEDPQLARIDENQEAIAMIRMKVQAFDDANNKRESEQLASEPNDQPESDPGNHWSCGASTRWLTSKVVEDEMVGNPVYARFDGRLRKFLTEEAPGELFGDTISIRRHHCLYLEYQSMEDWTQKRDILRCSPEFHTRERHDFVFVNTTSPPKHPPCARLYDLFTCKTLDGKRYDVALVTMLKPSTWKPNTMWDGCLVYEEPQKTDFIFMKYFIRGAYMCPAFGSNKDNLYYLIDTADYDMYLRLGN
ncbi:hypothetical protein R3P38DRAFT_2512305, partial [Favolaschia claudopus]